MRLFAIQVPGGSDKYNRVSRIVFRNFLLAEVGGFNERDVRGSWRDQKTGKDHIEIMVEYQVACDPALMFDIQQKAFELWPDEICFYVAELGTASIVYPPRKVMVAQ